MINKLRRTLGRNMQYAKINEEIDKQIAQLQMRTPFDLDSQMQIDVLQQQRENNLQHMNQPMTAEEYDEYDDNGEYIGNQSSMPASDFATQDSNIGQTAIDGVNHFAQGASLGWSDELNGIIGGAGRVAANGLMRATGNNANGESFGDAWNKGYTEYRDFARQELNNGYQRNPVVSGLAEVGGALASPIKPFSGMKSAVTNGVIGGMGITETNNPAEYAINIGLNTAGSVAGEKVGNILENKTNNFLKERAKNLSFGLSKSANAFTKMGTNSLTNQINSWRKDDE